MRNRSGIVRFMLPALCAGLVIGCATEPVPPPAGVVTWEDVPKGVLAAEDSAAFRISGEGKLEDFRIALRDSRLKSRDLSDLGLFRVSDKELEEVPFNATRDAIEADLVAGERYLVLPWTSPLIVNTYRLGCHLGIIIEDIRVREPQIVDPLCTRILCPAEPFRAGELFNEFPILNRFPGEFPEEAFDDTLIGGFSSPGPGGICEQCDNFTRPGATRILIPYCPPGTPPRPLTVDLINIVPNGNSAETFQDSEPNVAVNPADTQQVVASAFTANPLAANGNAPIYISQDGGTTWQLSPIVQSQRGIPGFPPTGDITVRFTQTTNTLYAGILRTPVPAGVPRVLSIQSTNNFAGGANMVELVNRNGPDQPYVQATDVGGLDRVYVGDNDLGIAGAQTASIDQTVDGAVTWTTQRVEQRNTANQDMPPVRPAIGTDNVIYAAFIGMRPNPPCNPAGLADVVVVRDDTGATGANPYQSLTGTDGTAGVRVTTCRNVPFNNTNIAAFGNARLVASDLSIAVDPSDSSRVCVAWGDRLSTATPPDDQLTLHVRCSVDSGQTWTATFVPAATDLRTIRNAKSPALAFNSLGTLGFLYMALTTDSAGTQRWIARFERFGNDFRRIDTTILARTPANQPPVAAFIPYIGDYIHLMSIDRTFYGIFSANNTPNNANFPQGVTYQRVANFATQQLQDGAGNAVAISIDPFFFTARE